MRSPYAEPVTEAPPQLPWVYMCAHGFGHATHRGSAFSEEVVLRQVLVNSSLWHPLQLSHVISLTSIFVP